MFKGCIEITYRGWGMQKPSFPQSSWVSHIPDSGFLHCCGGDDGGLQTQIYILKPLNV